MSGEKARGHGRNRGGPGVLHHPRAFMAGSLTTAHDAAILAIAAPNLLSELLEPVLSTVEASAAGRMGTVTLAALGIAEEANRLLTFGRHALSVSATPMVAAAVAVGELDRAASVVSNGVVLACAFGFVQLVLIRVGGRAVVARMTPAAQTDSEKDSKAAAQLAHSATNFLRIVGLAAPASLVGHVLLGSMSGALDPSTPLAIQTACSVVRAGATSLVSRKTSWGIEGVAWVQVCSAWTQTLLMAVAATRKGLLGAAPLRLALGAMLGGDGLDTVREYVSAASLLLLRTGAFQLAMTALSARAGRLGPSFAAAHKVGRQASGWISTSVDSIANAAQILIAARLASDPAMARAVANRTLVMGGAAGCVLGLALWFGRRRFISLFSNDPAVQRNSSLVLKASAVLAPVAAVAYILDGIALGSSDFRFLAKAMGAVGVSVFLTERLAVDRLLRLWRRSGSRSKTTAATAAGKMSDRDGWAALLSVQLLWAMFMAGRCVCIGGRHMLGAGPVG